MTRNDDTAATHLRRLGVSPMTVARLRAIAEQDEMTLADLVRYVLRTYEPASDVMPDE